MTTSDLVTLRRDLHRHPEPAWREFYTTARLVDELETRDLDALYVGREVLSEDERMAVPEESELDEWYERALAAGAREDVLEALRGGYTGAVAVAERGDGPTVALRVDIDGLPITESESDDHVPAATGFRSEHEGFMHACGHDAHAAIGLGVLDSVLASDFEGTLKVFFQPGEELVAGGRAMSKSGHLDDVDYLYGVHVGLDHPSGEIVAGIDGFLAVSHFRAEFTGTPSHAGARPEAGDNAVQAMAAAVQNLYGIPRHADGATRVNAGMVGGGTATNIVPEEAFIEGEVRGETTELMEYMEEKSRRVLRSAAEMHGCEVETFTEGKAPSARSDDELVSVVSDVARENANVTSLVERDALGGSEDATYLMREVQENGGKAAYIGVGTDHPGGHHTGTFDVDEDSIGLGIDVLSSAIRELSTRRP
ncbi:aminobenzoyl-glutamate utilization protein A [Halopelagius inordinatus]|uniref:Aminobenzoyl-glutamate utilization protein A n=1 Tax=Halopelagius inordinatus TaxID=553467 RepID=A0A1I2PBK4_9EURY|nr:amidohydrolase [Halopelagius inordinatus]SFG13464.1 aminobenzoyl-glutamate utilization protein A [Halopelagius inordinatus]